MYPKMHWIRGRLLYIIIIIIRIQIYRQFKVSNSPDLYAFGLQEETAPQVETFTEKEI